MTLLKTKAQRRLYWKTIDRLQGNSVKRFAGLVTAQLRADKDAAAKAVAAAQPQFMGQAATSAIAGQTDDWVTLYNRIYITNFEIFGARVVAQFEKSDFKNIDEAVRQRWALLAQAYVRNTAGQRIPGLLSNSDAALQRTIAAGIEEGKGSDAIARDIRALETFFNVSRSLRISRTEVIAASNLGSIEGAREVDPRMIKEWLSTPDSRTRETHVAADGQKRRLDDPFDVGGSQLMFPGDTSLGAPLSETVNERCTLAYIPNPVNRIEGSG